MAPSVASREVQVKYVVLYEAVDDPAVLSIIPEHFPAHHEWYQGFHGRGELLMIGPFSDRRDGAMAIFATREAAERFVAGDPFVRAGIVRRWHIREWNEALVD